MNKKILVSLSMIAAIAAIVVGGTIAYFSDTETSTGNTFTAGNLDLTTVSTGMPFALTNLKPGDTGSGKVALTNAGTIGAAELEITMSAITNTTESTAEAENDQSTDTGGDLGDQLLMVLWLDVDQSGGFNAGDIEILNTGLVSAYNAVDNPTLTYVAADTYAGDNWDVVLAAMAQNAVDDFVISWDIPTGADNRIMTDKMVFTVTFLLEQAGND